MLQIKPCRTVHYGRTEPGAWDLVAADQHGDRDAFGQLYGRYAGEVSRFVRSRTSDRGLAEDLTSETFLRALRRIDSVSDQGRDPGAWFTTIARNLIADHRKSGRYRLEQTTADVPDSNSDAGGVEQAVIARHRAAELRRCVAQLPRDQQECIRLRFLQGLSRAETAAEMGRTEGAVGALQHRAVGLLREKLADNSRAAHPAPDAADPMVRARRAVAEVQQRRAAQDRHTDGAHRDHQVARWHADDQAADLQHREHVDGHGALVLTTDGGGA